MAAKKKAAKKVGHKGSHGAVFNNISVNGKPVEISAALEGAVEASAFLKALDGPLTLGKHVRAIRQGEELSLDAFAKKLGVTRTYLSDVELGRRSVSLPRAAEWAALLGYLSEQFVRLALQAELGEAGIKLDVVLMPRISAPAPAAKRKAPRARAESLHAG